MAIAVNDLHKYYGTFHLLKGLTFEIFAGEKAGLLGKNGSGKTTLFKILSGEEGWDEGTVNLGGPARVLEQIPVYPDAYTVNDVLKTSFKPLYDLHDRMAELEKRLAGAGAGNQRIIREYGDLQMEYENLGGYTTERELNTVANGLKIDESMRNRAFNLLSGGEKTRVNLARIILERSGILLLDEPTNHLDISMLEWLEEYILNYKGTGFIISHDRYFLDKTVNKIIEIEDGKAVTYGGNYSFYIREKEERRTGLLKLYEKEQKKIKQLEQASARMHQWAGSSNNPALHRRAKAMEKRIERIRRTEKPRAEKSLKANFATKGFSGNEMLVLDGISKEFGHKKILSDIDLTVRKQDRIALIGDNGSGKTTLIKIITGIIKADGGNVKIGPGTKYSYLPQIIEFEDSNLSVMDTVRHALIISEEAARNRLGAYHFTGEDVFKPVGVLSGGEKSRLMLCIMMYRDINMLILDEPANHLDIMSREWIEEAMEKFTGTLLFVSHDRFLINKFATRIWELKGGHIKDFSGTYNDYRSLKEKQPPLKKPAEPVRGTANPKQDRKRMAKLRALETEISLMERTIADIGLSMEEQSSDYEALESLYTERENLEEKLLMLYMEMEELREIVVDFKG